MTDYERDIYSKIYDITEDNLKGSGLDMVTYKETLMASLDQEPSFVDLSVINDIPKERSVQALFYILFGRWVINDEEKTYYTDSNDNDKDFKIKLLSKIYNSTERMHAKRVIANYVDYSGESNLKVGKFKRNLLKFYANIKAKIPLGVKSKIKNLFLGIKA